MTQNNARMTPTAKIINDIIQMYLWVNGDYADNVDDKVKQDGMSSFLHNGFYVNGF